MNVRTPSPARRYLAIGLAGTALLLGACASNRLDAQWVDPQAAGKSLRGSKILIACSAYEAVLQRICQDQFSAEVTARGATAVLPPESAATAPGTVAAPEVYLAAARAAGASAVLSTVITTAATEASGSSMSIGIGGFGFGGGGGGVGAGVGVSAPIGGGRVSTGYAANGRLTDASNGRLMWTAKASTPPSSDVNAQLGVLARTLLDSAEKSGVL